MVIDGGYAFPVNTEQEYHGGMSMRDWFAGMALQGLYANEAIARSLNQEAKTDPRATTYAYAEMAYTIADTMISQGEK
jgi:hypothetical protein